MHSRFQRHEFLVIILRRNVGTRKEGTDKADNPSSRANPSPIGLIVSHIFARFLLGSPVDFVEDPESILDVHSEPSTKPVRSTVGAITAENYLASHPVLCHFLVFDIHYHDREHRSGVAIDKN